VYERNRTLLTIITGLSLAIVGSTVLLLVLGVLRGARPSPHRMTGCYITATPALYFLIWIPPVIFETIMFLLMIYKAWRTHIEGSDSPIVGLLVRDSILYFLSIFSALLMNCLLWALSPQNGELALGWAAAVPCALGSRLLLNMREGYFGPDVSIWRSPASRRSGTQAGGSLGMTHAIASGSTLSTTIEFGTSR